MRRNREKQGSYLRIIRSPKLASERASNSAPATPVRMHRREVSDPTNFLRFGTPANTIVHVPLSVARLNSKAKSDLSRGLYKFESLLHRKQPSSGVPVLENKAELLNTIRSVTVPIKSFNQVPRARIAFCISPKDLSESGRIRLDIEHRMRSVASSIPSPPLGYAAERSKASFLSSVNQIHQFSTTNLDALKRMERPTAADPVKTAQFFEYVKSGDAMSVLHALTYDKKLIHAKDSIGQTGLHWAAKRNDLPIIKLLKSSGADVNATDFALRTPLMLAVRKDFSDVVQFLLESGASKTMKSMNGTTVMEMAKEGSLSQALLSRRVVNAQSIMSVLLDAKKRKTTIKAVVESIRPAV